MDLREGEQCLCDSDGHALPDLVEEILELEQCWGARDQLNVRLGCLFPTQCTMCLEMEALRDLLKVDMVMLM